MVNLMDDKVLAEKLAEAVSNHFPYEMTRR